MYLFTNPGSLAVVRNPLCDCMHMEIGAQGNPYSVF